MEHLIAYYGPAAFFLGAVFEGETAAFLGGIFAHRGLMPYWSAAAAAVLGSWIGDQTLFYAGRYAERFSLVQRVLHAQHTRRAQVLLEAHPNGFIFSFRFILGMRIISPVIIGLSGISPLRFFVVNFAAASVWGIGVTAAGYFFGNAIEAAFGYLDLRADLFLALGIIAVPLVAATLYSMKSLSKLWTK